MRQQSPDSKLLLLTAYADTDVAIRAINDIALDYYLMKPWDPPEERLYPVLDDLLGDWASGHPDRDVRGARGRAPVVGADCGREDVPDPQPRALPLARRRARARTAPGCSTLAEAGADDLPARARCPTAGAARPHHGRARRARSGCARARSSRSTTCASSAADRPASPLRCTPRREGLRDRGRRARRTRRPGGAERVDRELPRLPQGAVRRRPHPPGGRPGGALRRRDGARARRRRLRDARPGARRAARRIGARSRRAPCSSPPACPTGASTRPGSRSSSGAACTTARARARRRSAGRGRLRRRARPTRPARRRSTSPATRSASCWWCAATSLEAPCRSTSSSRIRDRAQHRGAAGDRGRRCPRGRPPRGDHAVRPRRRARRGGRDRLAVRLHRGGAAHRLARRRSSPATTGASCSPADLRRRPTTGGRWTARPFALETSVPGVFAAGDVRLDSMKRVASAVGEGAMSVYLVHRYLATT